ncbi:hypothetical protein [Piscirickettsia salmonis]|uniref:hypothetical protein n=1 Tax=Piscirickettsia salmonis TaxID=1238 RepID=UPI000AEC010F|nr:hypothetical protein [Piscirickettsia salmonis]
MPRIIWDSEEQRALEWNIANDKLVAEPNGAKLKRADKKNRLTTLILMALLSI